MSLTQEEIKRIALEQSAIDAGCAPTDFLRSENVIVPSVVCPDARRYLKQPLECTLISYGANVVVTAQDAYRAIAADYVGRFSPAECFETPAMLLLDDALRAVVKYPLGAQRAALRIPSRMGGAVRKADRLYPRSA